MADVRPFGGLRFSEQPLAQVIAPPYDVISPEMRSELYERSPYNVIRLELGRESDPYAEAARTYEAWRNEGILRPDPPSFYGYEQRFASRTRRGIIARVRLEPFSAGVILPHEETLNKAKEDRLRLLQAVKTNVSPIFMFYDDPNGELRADLDRVFAGDPLATATDDEGEEHLLWRTDDQRISHFFREKKLFIADGHHRYETALAYSQESGTENSAFVMTVLVDFADPGLLVLPTHRLVHTLSAAMLRQLAEQLGDYFEVVAAAETTSSRALDAALAQLDTLDRPAYVLYGPRPQGLRILALKPEWRDYSFDTSRSRAWNRLDVSVLHAILGRILTLRDADMSGQRYFNYTRDPAEAIAAVDHGDAQLALLLRATPATAVRDVALAHDKMPQKSTYFYPKLATGIVLNPLD
ncbi:MAG: DUF1015 domain-containing protein [Chloroflexi bacterium]|nr:DUF1015 domain-containing protein [Chloroflexota bacterium]